MVARQIIVKDYFQFNKDKHTCRHCEKEFKVGEKIISRRTGQSKRYCMKCAILVHLWSEK